MKDYATALVVLDDFILVGQVLGDQPQAGWLQIVGPQLIEAPLQELGNLSVKAVGNFSRRGFAKTVDIPQAAVKMIVECAANWGTA